MTQSANRRGVESISRRAYQPPTVVAQRSCEGVIGRYRILGKLGQGGMGAVFKAEDQSNGQLVALKVIGNALADSPETLRRFRKEGRLLAQVQHPNIANLLEINEEDGIHYLVMEYISGGDLAQSVAGPRSTLGEACVDDCRGSPARLEAERMIVALSTETSNRRTS